MTCDLCIYIVWQFVSRNMIVMHVYLSCVWFICCLLNFIFKFSWSAIFNRSYIVLYVQIFWKNWLFVFSYISAISWMTSFTGGKSRSIRREPLTMGQQLVNLITFDSFNWKLHTEATRRRNNEFSRDSSGIHH